MGSEADRKHVISATAMVPADQKRVYAAIADYDNGHPHIVPKEFSNMVVEKGGVGAGTVIRFQMRCLEGSRRFERRLRNRNQGECWWKRIWMRMEQ